MPTTAIPSWSLRGNLADFRELTELCREVARHALDIRVVEHDGVGGDVLAIESTIQAVA